MTADISSSDRADTASGDNGVKTTRRYMAVAAVLFVIGLIFSMLAAFQLALPDLLSGMAYTTYGRLAPAGRALLWTGWLPLAGLGLTFYVLTQITGEGVKSKRLSTAALILIAFGAIAGAGDLIGGLSSGIPGQEGPIWVRGISGLGYLLAALAITATAKQKADRLGAAGWYLTAGAWWLAASSLVGVAPLLNGTAGSIQAAFSSAGMNRLFVMSMAVGLLYFAFSRISGADLTEPRPLAALGFWSLALTWASMGGVKLIYSATPNWYETLTVALAIGAFVPVLTIATDLGLLVKGRVQAISDRATLRYGVVAGLALVGVTTVNLLLTWRATSAVVQYSTWSTGLDALIVLGAGSFAIFAANSVRKGGSSSGTSLHFVWSVMGLIGASVALLAGGVISGFSWIAGPSSQLFANYGQGYEVAVLSLDPFLRVAGVSIAVFTIAQIVYLLRVNHTSDESLQTPVEPPGYDLEFEGSIRYVTWKRLAWGSATVWVVAAMFTAVLPMMDNTDTASTLTADRFRTYAPGTTEQMGRDIYISEGCSECHTQSVRPIVTDVGLGAVSVAGDYAHENPTLISGIRFGPDLTHVASREGFDPESLKAHLVDPRARRSWSTMPSYAHLSDADIDAIVSYIETLR
ncbi:MAG: cbb3-type cytochrome c oxidase subunit II [Actinomycetota bacterium]|nr:cbb3-type cytochrome c oxidase subunit II [Actinomycetota bacterium]